MKRVTKGMKKRRLEDQMGEEKVPIDIVYMILLLLPVKTLSRFRCVCNSWSTLISSPLFQQDHDQEGRFLVLAQKLDSGTLHLSTYDSKEITPVNNFSTPIPIPSLVPIQSCRGLLCLASPHHILLCNPSTQELLPLPPPPPLPSCSDCFGFGYAASSHLFKVVRFFRDYDPHDPSACRLTHCQVFTLGTARWRKARRPPPYHSGWRGAPFLHGALHLLPPPHRDAASIAAFDIHSENYKQIPLPAAYRHDADPFDSARLTELGASLCLTLDFVSRLDLWLLEDYSSAHWTKRYTIDLTRMPDFSSFLCTNSTLPLLLMTNGNLFINLARPDGSTQLVCYDPHKNAVTHKIGQGCSLTYYVDSFLSLGTR